VSWIGGVIMIPRILVPTFTDVASQYLVVMVTGPRQSGKTTLCRATFPEKPYVNLEAPDTREFDRSDPRGFLETHKKGAILDKIQRVPELLSYLQPMVDESHARKSYKPFHCTSSIVRLPPLRLS
jgi:hypothetical protein